MLDIIIPVYNEDKNIIKTFDEIEKLIKTDKQISVVYDFDEDTTIPIVKNVLDKYSFKISLIKNDIKRGVVYAIKKGLTITKEKAVLVMMADLSDNLDVVDEMYKKIKEGYDVVCGSRYMKGGEQHGGPMLKGFLSRMAGLSLHILTGVPTHDISNSFKMYSRKILNNINLESTGGFEVGLEIVVKAYCGGFNVCEIPSQWYDRTEGTSNFHLWKWLPHYLQWYFYCIKYYKKKDYI